MVNNEFHVIGICVSDFEVLSQRKYTYYSLKLEVEKYKGTTFDLEVVVYSSNKFVDATKPMLGKQVAVNGYVDSLKLDDGSLRTKLVVQNIMELSKSNKMSDTASTESKTTTDVVEDDLPF